MDAKNLFLIINSRYELTNFCKVLNYTVKDITPLTDGYEHRANYTLSIDSLNAFEAGTMDKQYSEIFPAILAFHSSLTEILPNRFMALSEQASSDPNFQKLESIIFLEEITRQLNNQNPNADGNILINDYLIKQKEHGTPCV